MSLHSTASRALAVCIAVGLLLGCASPNPPPSELTRDEWSGIQTLAIVPGAGATEITLWSLNAKMGSRAGALKAIEIANVLTLGLWPLAFFGAGLVGVPVLGAAIGAAVGGIRSPDHEELVALQQTLFDLIPPARLPQVIQEDLLEAGASHAGARRLVSLDAIEGRTARSRARSLRDRGIDAVLEVSIDTIEVSGSWGSNPDGALRMLLRFELVDTRSGIALFEGSHMETVGASQIEGWWLEPSAANPDPIAVLRDQLDDAANASALAIAEKVFLVYPWIVPETDPSTP